MIGSPATGSMRRSLSLLKGTDHHAATTLPNVQVTARKIRALRIFRVLALRDIACCLGRHPPSRQQLQRHLPAASRITGLRAIRERQHRCSVELTGEKCSDVSKNSCSACLNLGQRPSKAELHIAHHRQLLALRSANPNDPIPLLYELFAKLYPKVARRQGRCMAFVYNLSMIVIIFLGRSVRPT
jgi:hypothetical protein